MNLVPAFRNNSKLFKICKKQTTFEKRISTLSIGLGLKYKWWFCRETQNRALSSRSELLLPSNLNWCQLEAFLVTSLVSLTFGSSSLFLSLRKKNGNFAALVCCAVLHKCIQIPKIWLILPKISSTVGWT